MNAPPVNVVDASVTLKWVLNEPARDQALEILDEYESGRLRLIAPALLLEEAASAISKRCRRGELTVAQSQKAFEFLEQRCPELVGLPSLLQSALRLSVEHRISFWDCVYLSLALEYDCPLITADRRLSRAVAELHTGILLVSI